MTNEEMMRKLFNESMKRTFLNFKKEVASAEELHQIIDDLFGMWESDDQVAKREADANAEGRTIMTGYMPFRTGETTALEVINFLDMYDDDMMPTLFEYAGETYLGVAIYKKRGARGIDDPDNWEVIA